MVLPSFFATCGLLWSLANPTKEQVFKAQHHWAAHIDRVPGSILHWKSQDFGDTHTWVGSRMSYLLANLDVALYDYPIWLI